MAFKDDIEAGLLEIEVALDNQTYLDRGINYPCSPSSVHIGGMVEIGGIAIELDALLTVRTSAYGATPLPKRGKTITFKGQEFRVDTIVYDATGTFIKLGLISPNKGV